MNRQKRQHFWEKQDIQAITFDAVGTLIVPEPTVGEIYAKELSSLDIFLDPRFLEKKFLAAFKNFKKSYPESVLDRNSWFFIVEETLKDLTPPESLEQQFDLLWMAFSFADRWKILPNVSLTLQRLYSYRSDGLRLFVLSNNDERLHSVIKGLGLAKYFETIFISAELGAEKPSKKIFAKVQEKIALPPERILHVGDSPIEDIYGAINAGWAAAFIGSQLKQESKRLANFKELKKANSIFELFFDSIVMEEK